MSRLAYVTPDQAPDQFECRELFVPVGQSWEAILSGALHALTLPENYEQVGGLTADQAAAIFAQTWYAWDSGGSCPMFAGMIVAAARASTPEGWLLCDGTAYNEADYPALFDAIGAAFGTGGAGTFKVPDFRGRSPLGVGTGAGLTARAMADSGGEETHLLSVAELASHRHTTYYEQQLKKPGTTGLLTIYYPSDVFADPGTQTEVEETGDDTPHNTMHPFLAVNFFIYAGQ